MTSESFSSLFFCDLKFFIYSGVIEIINTLKIFLYHFLFMCISVSVSGYVHVSVMAEEAKRRS